MPSESISRLQMAFTDLWAGVIDFLPEFFTAIIVFVVGWVVAIIVGQAVARIIRMLRIDTIFENLGLKETLARADLKLDIGKFVGELVKWFIIVAALLTATDTLGLPGVTAYLQSVLLYFPNIIVASLILIATALVANFVQKLVKASLHATTQLHANFISAVAKWAIWLFGVFAALDQLGVAPSFVNTLLIGIVAMLALAAGLAFGLGGKDFAAGVIEKLRRDISTR